MDNPGSRAPKRSLGQNFLVDPDVVRRIVDAVGLRDGETLVEIGPGRGALTAGLRQRADRFLCIEKDDALAAHWKECFAAFEDARVLHADALGVGVEDLPFPGPYCVVANLPYNVGARITLHLLEDWGDSLSSATLMFQKEVADRLSATPGSGAYGGLSVIVQSFCEVWSLFGVGPHAFRPRPKVQSAVVRLSRRAEPLWAGLDYESFRAVVHGAFHARRKTVLNSMKLAPKLPSDSKRLVAALELAGVDPGRRAQELSVESFVQLTRALA